MVAFFLWGFIVEDDTYKSKQFQLTDSGRNEKGLNTRKHIKSEAASATGIERGTRAPAKSSPFRRGTNVSYQEVEIEKIHTYRSGEERRALGNEHATALLSIQNDIANQIELAKLWNADRNDPICIEIQELMAEKQRLTIKFEAERNNLISKRQRDDNVLDEAFVIPKESRRQARLSSSSVCWSTSSAGGDTTPVSEANAPPVSVAFLRRKPADDDIQHVDSIIQPSLRPHHLHLRHFLKLYMIWTSTTSDLKAHP
jgi:hypothetical protein